MIKTAAPRRRRWLLILGGVALGVVVCAGVLRIPTVQLWLLKRAVSLKSGWRVDFQRFSADPGGIESSVGLKVESNPIRPPFPVAAMASSIIASFGFSTGIGRSRAQASMHGPKAEQVNRMPSAPVFA